MCRPPIFGALVSLVAIDGTIDRDDDYMPRPDSEDETRDAFDLTVDYWRRWLSRSRYQGR